VFSHFPLFGFACSQWSLQKNVPLAGVDKISYYGYRLYYYFCYFDLDAPMTR
jgi:hypothetical protein